MVKKITFIVGSMIRGGSERVVSLLANYYAAKDIEVDIIMLLENAVQYELDSKVNILPICADETVSRLKRVPGWIQGIREYCKSNNPDVIIAFAARINIIALIATLGQKKRIIISERNDPKSDNRGRLGKLMVKLLYPFATDVIFQTKRVSSYFSHGIQAKSYVLPNPVSVETYASLTPEKKIVNLGKLLPQKNHEMLINAFCKIHSIYPEFKLHIFGEGCLYQQLQDQISSLGLRDCVFLRGNLPHIHYEIANAEIFVLSSNYEGMSNALLEAMMMGLPCISTDCAGSDETIEDGENGLLVPVGDVDKMASAMQKLISNRELRNKLAKNAKQSAEHYKKDKVIEMWDSVIYGRSI